MLLASNNMKVGNLIDSIRECEGKYRGEDCVQIIGEITIQSHRVYIKNADDDRIPKKYDIPKVFLNFTKGIQWTDGVEDTSDPFVQQMKTFLEGIHLVDVVGLATEHGNYLLVAMYGPKVFSTDELIIRLPITSEDIRTDVFYFTIILHFRFGEENNPERSRVADIRICVAGDCRMIIEYEQYYFVYKIDLKYRGEEKFKHYLDKLNGELSEEWVNDEVEPGYISESEEIRRGKFQMIIDVKMEEEEPHLVEEVHPEPDSVKLDKPRKRKFKPVPVQVKEEEEDEPIEREIKMEEMDLPIEREVEMQKNVFVQPKSWKELYDNLRNALFEFEDGIEHKKQYNFTIQFKGESLEKKHAPGLRHILMNIRYDGMLVSVERISYDKIYPLNDLKVKRYEICTKNDHPERQGFLIYSEIYRGRLYVFMYLEGDKYRISF